MANKEIEKLRKKVAALETELREQKGRESQTIWLYRFLGHPYVQAVLVLIPLAVAFSGKLASMGTEVCILVAFLIGSYGIWCHCSKTSLQKIVALGFVVIYAIALWKFNVYLLAKAGPLTAKQRDDFTAVLRSVIVPPDYIKIACPDAHEEACVYAATFIPMFQRAGWKVEGPTVERVRLGRPSSDIVIVHYGPPLVEPQNPDLGVWTQVTPWDQILKTAFEVVGVRAQQWNDPSLPKTMMRVYFGSSPKR